MNRFRHAQTIEIAIVYAFWRSAISICVWLVFHIIIKSMVVQRKWILCEFLCIFERIFKRYKNIRCRWIQKKIIIFFKSTKMIAAGNKCKSFPDHFLASFGCFRNPNRNYFRSPWRECGLVPNTMWEILDSQNRPIYF